MAAPAAGGSTALSALEIYQKNAHLALLGGGLTQDTTIDGASVLSDVGVIDYLKEALETGNPYSSTFAYDPSSDLSDVQGVIDNFRAYVDSLSPETDYGTYITEALRSVNEDILPDSYIDDAVDAFETASAPEFARSINRFTAPMSGYNAVMGSAFVIGLAQLERGRSQQLAAHRSVLVQQREQSRNAMVMQFASEIARTVGNRLEAERIAAQMQGDASRMTIIANKEFLAEELELDYKDVTYDMELFNFANSTLASGLGAASHAQGPSKASTQLSAAITTGGTLASLASPLGVAPALLAFAVGGGGAWAANA